MNQSEYGSRSRVILTDSLCAALEKAAGEIRHNALFLLTDTNVRELVIPKLSSFMERHSPETIVIEAGERFKNLETLARVWTRLSDGGATRSSLLINIGGGVVTDLGGFAAATFKRGIRFINVPTTVLGAVDAAVGGKTGIDFNGLKNEIGSFCLAENVIVSPEPLATLPDSEIRSGYAEMVKTAMLDSDDFYVLLLSRRPLRDDRLLAETMTRAVKVKEDVTGRDLREGGLRKILNLGHTAGHAFETLMIERKAPVSHGEAVAHGLLVTLILSHMMLGMDSSEIYRYADNILRPLYRPLPISCKDYPRLIELMGRDKKNEVKGNIRFVLLKEIGCPERDITVDDRQIEAALDIYLDIMG